MRVLGVSKTYPGARSAAVLNVQFGIREGECFGLLGSNGAGKSTTIHVLCGVHAPSSGTVLCADGDGGAALDIRTDIKRVQSSMGVCSQARAGCGPRGVRGEVCALAMRSFERVCAQDDLLWADLTGAEHLRFFARLRRVGRAALAKHVDYWLRRVSLHSAADRAKLTRHYSGGMKRRATRRADRDAPRTHQRSRARGLTARRVLGAGGSRSRTRSSATRSWCTSTSRRPASTPRAAGSCGTRCARRRRTSASS